MRRAPSSPQPVPDAKITPWPDERENTPPPSIRRGRGMRDWIVLIAAVILGIYVLGFLLLLLDSPGSGGNLFRGGGSIALIPVEGEITSSPGNGVTSYQEIIQSLDEASSNTSVRAVLLEINSGGGSVVATHQVVTRIREMDKPVVAWIGEAGASGAYYIAAAGNHIIADPDAITGSIGVISRQPKFYELLEKIGVEWVTIQTGELKDIGSPFRAMTEEERELFEQLVEESFLEFVKDIRSFRGDNLVEERFLEVLDGRIVSGRQAVLAGLIDETGTREYAILKAGELGGIEGKPNVIVMREERFTLGDLLFAMGQQFGKGFTSSAAGLDTPALSAR
ncbi:MAG: signal peptide peptidase SppA [Candidatus Diapherotrites archaeon]|nr:signal peptide peptidase SppA [Candidatus Diapherotrites archaeon]MDZ4256256.1 signal peptide peptidase SppA [archaeon]